MLDDTGSHAKAYKYNAEVMHYVPEDAEVHESYARSLGKAGKTLDAYIHMTYSALYSNNKKQTERFFKQARALADRSPDRRRFQRLEAAYKERKEIWEKH